MQSKHHKRVVKFTGITDGYLVVADKTGGDSERLGDFSESWINHTNTDHWQPIAFDEELGIAHKQLCECWQNENTHMRVLRFYDAINKRTFDSYGNNEGVKMDNYLPISYADYPDWAIEAEKTLRG
jgi:hypothetical protein